MIKEELKKYSDSVLKFFNIDSTKRFDANDMLNESSSNESLKGISKEFVITDLGTKFYVSSNVKVQSEQTFNLNDSMTGAGSLDRQNLNDESGVNDSMAYDDFLTTNSNKLKVLIDIHNKPYLKFSYIPIELFKSIKNA